MIFAIIVLFIIRVLIFDIRCYETHFIINPFIGRRMVPCQYNIASLRDSKRGQERLIVRKGDMFYHIRNSW